jgi:hypothetical protein
MNGRRRYAVDFPFGFGQTPENCDRFLFDPR